MMGRLVVGVVALAVVVWLATAGVHVTTGPGPAPSVAATPVPTPTPTPDPFAFPRWAATNVALIFLLLSIGIGVPVGIALHMRHRSKLLEVNAPPLRDREAVHSIYAVRQLEARRGWLPESFTYSPHLRTDAALEPAALPMPNLPNLSLEDLMRGPGVTYGQDVLTGRPVTDDRVRSLLVGGIPGSGKSTLVTLVVAQLVNQGASISLGDPHAGHPESLANRLEALGVRPQVEEEPRLIKEQVETAALEIQSRKHSTDRRPLVVVVDELPEQIRLLGDRDRARLREALEIIGFGGRKFGVSVILLAQSWTRAVVGGTAVRNLVPAAGIFRMRRDEALAMSGIRAESWPDDPLSLPPGEAYLVGVSSDISRIRVPALPSTLRSTLQSTLPPTLQPAFSAEYAQGRTQSSAQGRDAEILSLFKEGLGYPQIVQRLYPNAAGSRFKEARSEVETVIRRALG